MAFSVKILAIFVLANVLEITLCNPVKNQDSLTSFVESRIERNAQNCCSRRRGRRKSKFDYFLYRKHPFSQHLFRGVRKIDIRAAKTFLDDGTNTTYKHMTISDKWKSIVTRFFVALLAPLLSPAESQKAPQ